MMTHMRDSREGERGRERERETERGRERESPMHNQTVA